MRLVRFIEIIKKYNIQGLIISNTTDNNRDKLNDFKKSEAGGLSGQPLKDISTQLIKKFYKEIKGEIQIVGVGGVDSGESAFEKITAGANAVQLYTGMVYKGPGVVKSIKKVNFNLKKQNIKILKKQLELTLDPFQLLQLYSLRKIMSKRCELTGISPLKGHNVSHAKKNKTKKVPSKFKKKFHFRSEILKKDIKLNVANAALRTVDFKGGLDKFLLNAKNANLSKKVKKIKASISAKS